MSQLNLDSKRLSLEARLRALGSVLVAYSGGVDSSFLLKVAKRVLGDKVLAVTAVSETYPESELKFAKGFIKKIKARHKVIKTRELKNPRFKRNPENRCYYCKKELFATLKVIAKANKLNFIVDGSNIDDLGDYRPGAKAKKEYAVVSPLQEAGLTKQDVRDLSKKMGLSTWCKPALACLASRIPYHSAISKKRLLRVDRAEAYLRKKFGMRGNLRVRDYGSRASIEVDKAEIKKITSKTGFEKLLKAFGYKEATVDPAGYRMGSLNKHVNVRRRR